MNVPPLLIGFVVLFWGFESDRIVIAVILALMLEGSHLVKSKYALDESDFVKISDLTSLLFLGGVALILLNYEAVSFLRITTGWLPLILAPLIGAQLYSTSDTVTIGTRLGKRKKSYTHNPIDFRFYYIALCLFAAATGNSRSLWFYPVVGLIVTILFFNNRGRSYSPLFFCFFMVSSLTVGYLGGVVMEKAHGYVVDNSFRFLYRYYRGKNSNPFKTHVNFGDTGRLKYSGEILMRVASPGTPPTLLKEAVYSTYERGDWFGNQSGYKYLLPEDEENWNLIKKPHPQGKTVEVELGLPKEKGLLPAPSGGYQLNSRTLFELEQNGNGTLKAKEAAEVVTYRIAYRPGIVKEDDVPKYINNIVPKEEAYVLEQVASQLAVADRPAGDKIDALRKFFTSGFSYSLNLVGRGQYSTPLGNFLLHKKQGFCEYYATAAALLLRTMDIPSRYVVGYAVNEYSPLEGKYIVRSRHAHAWAEAYVDGHWLTVDTTPAEWFEMDAQRASSLEGLKDIFSFIHHKYKLFSIGSGQDYTLLLSIVVVLLTTFLVIRIYRRMRLERNELRREEESRSFERIITPFTPIIDSITATGQARQQGESFADWAARCYDWQHFDKNEFEYLYNLHLQLRFDPYGAGEEIEQILQREAEKYRECLVTYR